MDPEKKRILTKAIDIIEKKSVYRVTATCDDGSAFFTSINGMPQTNWKPKQIFALANLMKNRPDMED